MTPFEIVLAALDAHGCQPKRRGEHMDAHCPAHDDLAPSLELDVGKDGRALVHCFAGCSPQAVVAALDLKMSDLFVHEAAKRKSGSRRRVTRSPTGVLDDKYSITPRFVSESADPMCVKLYDYLDLRQGTRGRFAVAIRR